MSSLPLMVRQGKTVLWGHQMGSRPKTWFQLMYSDRRRDAFRSKHPWEGTRKNNSSSHKSAVCPSAQTHSTPWKSCISGAVHLLALCLAVLSKNLCASWLWGTKFTFKLDDLPSKVNNNSKNIWAGLNSSFPPLICFSLTLQMDHQDFPEGGTRPDPHNSSLSVLPGHMWLQAKWDLFVLGHIFSLWKQTKQTQPP